MTETTILNVAVNVPLSRQFDYLPATAGAGTQPGTRVLVPFGRRRQVGLVMDCSANATIAADKLKACIEVLDDKPLLREADLWLIRFTSNYYQHPIGEVAAAALPPRLRQGKSLHQQVDMITATAAGQQADLEGLAKRAPKQAELLQILMDAGDTGLEAEQLTGMLPTWRRAAKGLLQKELLEFYTARSDRFAEELACEAQPGPTLNGDQQAALETLRQHDNFAAYLLDGVTGSGKTEVYLQRVRDMLAQGKQTLILVPEIGLTPQLVARLSQRLGLQPALLHSGLSDNARLAAWRAARAGTARLIVGTRSAIFTPLKNPGLIIVDEEHDHSFKQQEGLRYSARDLAVAKAKRLDIPVILGSATPTLEVLQHCRDGNYQRILLPTRAGAARPPQLRLIDTVRTPTTDGISEPLATSIRQHIDAGNQTLLFLNRRGFAPTLICSQCGHIAGCARCDARLTVHARNKEMRCHHCGLTKPLTEQCDECGEIVRPLGEGTERLEDALRARFPDAVISRIDSDSTQLKGAMQAALQSAADGSANILVGTQMLSKGHHFPKLTMVGVVNADQGLFGTDFRSGERLAQSIVQVAGRAGRESCQGEVLIQTAFPDNPFWATLISGGYQQLADEALAEREQTRWPPFTRLALIRAAAHKHADAHRFLNMAAGRLHAVAADSIRVLGPVDAPMARKAGRYRVQLLVQSSNRATLQQMLRQLRPELESHRDARKVRWSIDVDPIELF